MLINYTIVIVISRSPITYRQCIQFILDLATTTYSTIESQTTQFILDSETTTHLTIESQTTMHGK